MDQKQRLELAQVLKLSPSLLQSMGILQMTTLELADYFFLQYGFPNENLEKDQLQPEAIVLIYR